MKVKTILLGFLCFFLIGSITAMSVSFYHSEVCPYCKQIYPFVREQVDIYPAYQFGLYEVSTNEGNQKAYLENNFDGVPAFLIKTNDCRDAINSFAFHNHFVNKDKISISDRLQAISINKYCDNGGY